MLAASGASVPRMTNRIGRTLLPPRHIRVFNHRGLSRRLNPVAGQGARISFTTWRAGKASQPHIVIHDHAIDFWMARWRRRGYSPAADPVGQRSDLRTALAGADHRARHARAPLDRDSLEPGTGARRSRALA